MKVKLDIFDTDLVWKGTIEDIQTLVLRSSWNEITNSELKVSSAAQGVEELQIGRVLVVNADRTKATIIEDLEISLDEQTFSYTLVPLKSLLNMRIAHPTDSTIFTNKTQSNIMQNLVKSNIYENTRDTNRKFLKSDGITNMFAVASIKEYGDLMDFTVNWDTGPLGDLMTTLSKVNGTTSDPLGWNVYIHSAWQLFYMDVYQSTNRTINQSTNPPVIFSEEFGNLKNATYSEAINDWKNWGYVIWDNNDVETVTSVANSKYGTAKWFNRREIILDSSKKASTQVSAQGRAELRKRPRVQSFEAEVINSSDTMSIYNADWFLGDLVTVQSSILKNTLVSIDVQITEIEEIYDNGEYGMNVTFGDGKLSLIQKIKNTITKN